MNAILFGVGRRTVTTAQSGVTVMTLSSAEIITGVYISHTATKMANPCMDMAVPYDNPVLRQSAIGGSENCALRGTYDSAYGAHWRISNASAVFGKTLIWQSRGPQLELRYPYSTVEDS